MLQTLVIPKFSALRHYEIYICLVTFIGWIAMKCCVDIHSAQTMNHNNFGDPLIFPLALPSSQKEDVAF